MFKLCSHLLIQDSREDDKHSTPIQSVDSALESWDSSRSGMESNSQGSGNNNSAAASNATSNNNSNGNKNPSVAPAAAAVASSTANHVKAAQNTGATKASVQSQNQTGSDPPAVHRSQSQPAHMLHQNQTVSGPVTVHRSLSQPSDHRTVPNREVVVLDDAKPVKPPVAPKPAFCNSQNCRLSHGNTRPVPPGQDFYKRRGSKSNPNLLSASSDYPDSYYRSMGHAHSLHYHHNSDASTKPPPANCQDDLHITESSEAVNIQGRRDSHYHSDPDLSGSPENQSALEKGFRDSGSKQACERLDRLLSPIVSVSKASTPDPTIAKGK